jgi:hypothetical protein
MSLNGIVNQVAGGVRGNTATENQWIANAPPEMQGQLEMQKMQELVQLITQMMKAMHEMSMSIIRNIGG